MERKKKRREKSGHHMVMGPTKGSYRLSDQKRKGEACPLLCFGILIKPGSSLLFFLSLLRAQRTHWLLLSSSSFSSDAHKHTYAQTHPHRQINTQIHKHTHTQTNPHGQTNRETNRCLWNDQCLTRVLGS